MEDKFPDCREKREAQIDDVTEFQAPCDVTLLRQCRISRVFGINCRSKRYTAILVAVSVRHAQSRWLFMNCLRSTPRTRSAATPAARLARQISQQPLTSLNENVQLSWWWRQNTTIWPFYASFPVLIFEYDTYLKISKSYVWCISQNDIKQY